MAAIATTLFILLVAFPAVYAAQQHVVGGSSGWTNFGPNYSTWAAAQTFDVGDTLVFNYGGSHQVAEVSKNDYDSCSPSNAINTYNDGSTTITLDKVGSRYFICPVSGHCQSGMKLAITTVAAASTTPGATPSTPSPATPSGTTTAGTPAAPKSGTGAGATNMFSNTWMLGFFLVLGIMLISF